jgi:hypothetical protein
MFTVVQFKGVQMNRAWLRRAWLFLLVVAVSGSSAWAQAPGVDPQSLIGQWSGSWTGAALAKANGKYYLKIERVEGAKVFGTGEVSGHKNTEFPLSGTLSGNQLTYGKTTLTIDGNHMTGKGQSMDISLTKE